MFFTQFAYAQNFFQIYRPLKPFPQEFIYLYESAQINDFKQSHQGKFNFTQFTEKLDHFCQENRPEEITLYFKSIIYKKFLEVHNSKIFDFDLNKSVSDKIADLLASNKEANINERYLSISEWLVSAIFYDIKNIMNDPLFSTYKLAKEQKSIEGIRIYNKIGLLAPLINNILELTPAEFNNFTSDVSFSLFDSIIKSMDIISKLMPKIVDPLKAEIKKNTPTSCFQIIKVPIISDKTKDIENILQKIETPSASNIIIKNYWVPKNAPPNYPTPDPNYSPPAQLPKPINDWN